MSADDELATCGDVHQDGYTCSLPKGHGGYVHDDELGMARWPTGLTPGQEIRELKAEIEVLGKSVTALGSVRETLISMRRTVRRIASEPVPWSGAMLNLAEDLDRAIALCRDAETKE